MSASIEFFERSIGILLFRGSLFFRHDVDYHDRCIVQVVLGDSRPQRKSLSVRIAGLAEVGIIAEEQLGDGVVLVLPVVVFVGGEDATGLLRPFV